MKIDLSGYQGVIFDMDGTLIDTMPAHLDAWRITAEHFDFPYDREWIHTMGGKPSFAIAQEVCKRYGVELDCEAVAQVKMTTFAEMDEKGELIPHTFEILKSIHGKKRIALGTGSQRENTLALLDQKGVTSYFEAVVTSSDVSNYKPAPDTFAQAAEKLGIAAKDCVVFEDTDLGRQAAHAAGMDCIMVTESGFELVPVK